jgi:four helix bundle protein
MKENIVQEKSYSFALKIIDLYRKLSEQKEFVISNQILKSGTSIGANVEEATAGLSKRDFTAKMAISSKEARETNYWLRLLRDSELCPSVGLSELLEESEELVSVHP